MAKQYTEYSQLPLVMTTLEVARLLRLTEVTINRWLNAGTLPATKIGNKWLINKSDVLMMLGVKQ